MHALYLVLITVPLVHLAVAQHTDFLIVGGGTAGCVLASKLCVAFPNTHVTVLERGLPRSAQSDFLVHAPRKLFDVLGDRSVGEAITSLPDAGINGRTTVALTGATLGGSTAINGMQWTLPLSGTIEQWGVPNLTTASADRYFRRIYDKVGFGPPQNPLQYADDYVNAGVRAGYELDNNPFDVSSRRTIWQTRLSIDSNFRRNDACSAYLLPLLDNSCAKNVAVVQGVTASKIVLTTSADSNTGGTTLRATAVDTVPSPGSTQKAQRYWARREVLVTAGPYNSPKLLQLSGIGTRAVLEAAGVAQLIELPVGEATVGRASGTIPSTYTGVPDEAANNITVVNSPQARQQWEQGLGGILGTPVSAANGKAGTDAYFGSTIIPFVPGPPELRSACYHNTETTGYVRIRDSNPFSPPLLKNNFLSSQTDVDRLKRCLESMADVHGQFPANFKMKFKYPPNGVVTEGYVRSVAQWGAHFVGGCAIGDVLTGEFKVKGCSGLRVIDASSIPKMPVSAGPMACVYLLAELMGDRLVEEYRNILS